MACLGVSKNGAARMRESFAKSLASESSAFLEKCWVFAQLTGMKFMDGNVLIWFIKCAGNVRSAIVLRAGMQCEKGIGLLR